MTPARCLFSLGCAVALFSVAGPAHATYSIVAADTRTKQTGGAGTSCVRGQDVSIIHAFVPGIASVHAQATFNVDARDRARELLSAGLAPSDVIADITSLAFDPAASTRQYGIADAMGRTAVFTGVDDGVFAGDRRGASGNFVYSVQGNLLTSRAVVDQAANAFEASGCDLAERLMRALEAGADNGEGDRRCTPRGIPSDSAFIQVNPGDPLGAEVLRLRVPTSGNENPLAELRVSFDAWRQEHPCDEGSAGGQSGPGTGMAGAAQGLATDAGACGCRLPRGRTSGPLSLWLVALTAAFVARRRRPRAVSRVPAPLSAQEC